MHKKKASRVYLEEDSVLRTCHKNLLKRIKLAQSGRIDNIAFLYTRVTTDRNFFSRRRIFPNDSISILIKRERERTSG